MSLDILTLTVALAVGEATAAIFYPFYLWITFGMGFRYGRRYLFVSAASSLISFALVFVLSDYWRGQAPLASGLWIALLVLPAYASSLLTKLTDALARAARAEPQLDPTGGGDGHPDQHLHGLADRATLQARTQASPDRGGGLRGRAARVSGSASGRRRWFGAHYGRSSRRRSAARSEGGGLPASVRPARAQPDATAGRSRLRNRTWKSSAGSGGLIRSPWASSQPN
jgi:hypothetical protein